MKKFFQLTNKSFDELGVKSHQELWEKVKGDHKGLCACVNTVFTKAEDSENKFNVVMSTATEDRHGDIVEQNWDLKNFKKNPVFLDSHNYSSIEHIIGKVNKIKVKDGALTGEIEFALDNPKGLLAYNLASKGFLNATSVGFIPLEFSQDGKIVKSELLEDSAVSVPANQEALFEKKSIEDVEEVEVKNVVPFKRYELAPEDTDWDAKDEVSKVADMDTLKRMSAWYDGTNIDAKESYKLQHHQSSDLMTVWKAVEMSMKAFLSGQGGVKIPDEDRERVYNHLAKHYAEFGKEVPELKSVIEEEKPPVPTEPKKNLKLEALKRIAEKQEYKRKEILKEVLAVTQQLSKSEVDAELRRQKANRVIKLLMKIK